MLTHEQIWKAIDRLADSHGYSTSGLARRAGLDPTTFNRSKRFSSDGKERWPSTESVAKVLGITGSDLASFVALIDDGQPQTSQSIAKGIGFAYVPSLRLDQAGQPGMFDEDGLPKGASWSDRAFPDKARQGEGPAYALEISGDSLAPLYRAGDILIIAPKSPTRRGDRVVICTRKGEIRIMELLRQTATRVDLLPLNSDAAPVELSLDSLSWMARIIWVSQ